LRKGLTIFSLILIILIVFSQAILPPLAEKTLQTRVTNAMQAKSVDVSVATSPAILLLLGQADRVNIKAQEAYLGQVRVKELSLDGKNIGFDLGSLDAQDGSAVRRADKLELRAVITEDSLAELIKKKIDKIENVEVKITPEAILVSGQAKIMGRMADIHVEGQVLEENSSIYFRMSKLSIKNAILGKAVIGNFFGDILLTNLHAMPFKAELDDVVQKDGEVIITASRHQDT
jgi:hypothetical protein